MDMWKLLRRKRCLHTHTLTHTHTHSHTLTHWSDLSVTLRPLDTEATTREKCLFAISLNGSTWVIRSCFTPGFYTGPTLFDLNRWTAVKLFHTHWCYITEGFLNVCLLWHFWKCFYILIHVGLAFISPAWLRFGHRKLNASRFLQQ